MKCFIYILKYGSIFRIVLDFTPVYKFIVLLFVPYVC